MKTVYRKPLIIIYMNKANIYSCDEYLFILFLIFADRKRIFYNSANIRHFQKFRKQKCPYAALHLIFRTDFSYAPLETAGVCICITSLLNLQKRFSKYLLFNSYRTMFLVSNCNSKFDIK